MNYLTFQQAFQPFNVFSVNDIHKKFPDFDSRRLIEWQQKDYLIKIRRGYYCFKGADKGLHFIFYTANKIYVPSYISLESALSYYNFIPEGVFTTTSVTSRNTQDYNTSFGHFSFKHLKPVLFFGYTLVSEKEYTIQMASPEKAILDYLYLNKLNTEEDIKSMRWNRIVINETLDVGKFKQIQKAFDSKALNKRIQLFLKIIYD